MPGDRPHRRQQLGGRKVRDPRPAGLARRCADDDVIPSGEFCGIRFLLPAQGRVDARTACPKVLSARKAGGADLEHHAPVVIDQRGVTAGRQGKILKALAQAHAGILYHQVAGAAPLRIEQRYRKGVYQPHRLGGAFVSTREIRYSTFRRPLKPLARREAASEHRWVGSGMVRPERAGGIGHKGAFEIQHARGEAREVPLRARAVAACDRLIQQTPAREQRQEFAFTGDVLVHDQRSASGGSGGGLQNLLFQRLARADGGKHHHGREWQQRGHENQGHNAFTVHRACVVVHRSPVPRGRRRRCAVLHP